MKTQGSKILYSDNETQLLEAVDVPDPGDLDDLSIERLVRLFDNLRFTFVKEAIMHEVAKRELDKRRNGDGGKLMAAGVYTIPPGQIRNARRHACRAHLYNRELTRRITGELEAEGVL